MCRRRSNWLDRAISFDQVLLDVSVLKAQMLFFRTDPEWTFVKDAFSGQKGLIGLICHKTGDCDSKELSDYDWMSDATTRATGVL